MEFARNCALQVDALQQFLAGKPSAALIREGSPIALLLCDLPDGPVTLDETIWEGLWTEYTSLMPAINAVNRPRRDAPAHVILTLLRTSLLASARVVYATAPGATRLERATQVMRQEAVSLKRWYGHEDRKAFADWMPEDAEGRLAAAAEHNKGRGLTETAMLRQLAAIAFARDQSLVDSLAGMERDLAWTFNVASGVAHGFAWPWQLRRVGDFPGDFVRMLTVTALVVDSAHQLAFAEGGLDPLQIISATTSRRRLRKGIARP